MSEPARYCTFAVGSLLVGIDVDRVREIVIEPEIVPVPFAPPGVLGLINRRGEIITAIDARVRFGGDATVGGPVPETHVILRVDGETISLAVEAEGDVIEVDPALLQPVPETVSAALRRLLRGVAPLPDGRLMVDLRAERAVAEVTA
jgi:purine-binding chemotaxis protein CheW